MWDERYRAEGYVYGTEPNGFLVSVVDRIPVGRLLSLAEGEGRNAVFLAEKGYDVTAVDASGVGLAKGERLARKRGVTITTVVADLAEFDMGSGRWDGIVSIFCHLPPEVRTGLHRRVVQGLRRGGVFVLEAYTPAQLLLKTGGPPSEEMMMSLALLREELRGLSFLHAVETEREVREGTQHTGRGAVVQLVAVKP